MSKFSAMVKILAKSAVILISVIVWIVGLVQFKNSTEDGWFVWGGICCIGMAGTILGFLGRMFKGGYEEGTHHWGGSWSGNSFNMSDKRWLYALIYVGIGILLAVLAGPIVLPIVTIINIVKLVQAIRDYRYLV